MADLACVLGGNAECDAAKADEAKAVAHYEATVKEPPLKVGPFVFPTNGYRLIGAAGAANNARLKRIKKCP